MTKRDVVNMAAIVAFTFGLFGGLLKIISDGLSIILVLPAMWLWATGRFDR